MQNKLLETINSSNLPTSLPIPAQVGQAGQYYPLNEPSRIPLMPTSLPIPGQIGQAGQYYPLNEPSRIPLMPTSQPIPGQIGQAGQYYPLNEPSRIPLMPTSQPVPDHTSFTFTKDPPKSSTNEGKVIIGNLLADQHVD